MRNFQVNKIWDIYTMGGLEILDQIFPAAVDAILKDQDYELVFPDAESINFLHRELKEKIPASIKINGTDVTLTYATDTAYDIKTEVENATATAAIEKQVAAELSKYNITDADETAAFIKKCSAYAQGEVKKLCKLFSQRVHEKFSTQFNVGVETIFMKAEFGVIGYFQLNQDGTRGHVLNINEDRLAYRIQMDSSVLKKAGEKSECITADYASVKGTKSETKLIAAIQPIIPTIDSFGKQLKLFSSSFKEIKSKTGGIRLEIKDKKANGTTAKAEKSAIAQEEEGEE